MNLNLQNKIYGMKFATALVRSHQKDHWVSEKNFLITDHTRREMGIPEDFCDDFISQIKKIGSFEDLRVYFKLEDYGGVFQSPIVLRHKKFPEIIAHLTIQDRDTNAVWTAVNSPVNAYYDAQILMNCFIDVSHEGSSSDFAEFDILAKGGIGEK